MSKSDLLSCEKENTPSGLDVIVLLDDPIFGQALAFERWPMSPVQWSS